jgi:uncharacterized protein YcaQ
VVSQRLSAAAARRIALAAQGFGRPRPTTAARAGALRAMIDQLGLLQLDSVNVLSRAHYLPAFSRFGPYDTAILDDLAWGPRRELFEYWAHEASLLPARLEPFLRWRMARAHLDAWGGVRAAAADTELIARVRAAVTERGPARIRDLGLVKAEAGPCTGGLWNWGDEKRAIEYLFWSGEVSSARRVNFERHYDLAERVHPAAVRDVPTPPVGLAQQELIRVAARALGVGTEADLRDYFRLPAVESRTAVAALVESGELVAVTVDGWRHQAYLWPDSRRPRSIAARALLSPFDSLIFFRERVERIFGFRYRIEIYTPAEKRVHGYYVLPFLLGEALVARVDLKADRGVGVLRVSGAFGEDGIDPVYVATELAAELGELARWLGLDTVEVRPNGDLAGPLATAVAVGVSD